jgi:hypothetical protein
MMRAVLPAPPAPAAGCAPRTVAEMEGAIDAGLDAALPEAGDARRLPALSNRIARRADQSPEAMARLVRGWLAEEES